MKHDPRTSAAPKKKLLGERSSTTKATKGAAGHGQKGSKRRSKAPHPMVLLGSAILLLGLAGVFGAYLALPHQRATGAGKQVFLQIGAAESRAGIALQLENAGVVSDAGRFELYARLRGIHIAPGDHLLRDNWTLAELGEHLERKSRNHAKVAVPEGFTLFDIAKRLEEKGICSKGSFVAASTDFALLQKLQIAPAPPAAPGVVPSAEGYLFPATYDFAEDEVASVVVERMVAEFERRWKALAAAHPEGFTVLSKDFGWTRREVVVLASMIEKEAAVDEERATISGVFQNRFRDPAFPRKVLQSDPTAGYGCLVAKELPSSDAPSSCAGYQGRVTAPIVHDKGNRYSTYTHEGLPPGPIANPGTASMEAAMAPAATKYLYFVARGGGRHTFSETFDAHTNAVSGRE